jgi:hypothetical protein
MGRLLTNGRITESNIQHYLEQATKDYSTFLASAPTFCTYFSKDSFKSTYDRSLENISEVVGADSPVVFNKIENLPIYKIENASFGTEITDFGIVGSVTSSCIVLPDTIIPLQDDLIFLKYQNVSKLFLVTDVEQDNYNNSKYYKVTFRLSDHDMVDVAKQVGENLVVDYDLIGQSKNPIVKKTAFELGLAIEDIYDGIARWYNEIYYDNETFLFVDQESDRFRRSIIDPLLNDFIQKQKLIEFYTSYRDFRYSSTDFTKGLRRGDTNRSIYGILSASPMDAVKERLSSDYTAKRGIIQRSNATRYSMDWFSSTNHYILSPILDTSTTAPIDEIVFPIDPAFLDEIQNNIQTNANPYKKFLTRTFNGYYNESNFHEIPNDVGFVDDFNDNYYIVPLVLFSLRYYRREVVSGQ